MSTEQTPENLTEDAFDLLDYINSGTVAKRQVVLYSDDDAGRELGAALEALKALGVDPDDPYGERVNDRTPKDGPLDEDADADVDELVAAAEAARDRLEASKSTWTVRAISQDEIREAMKSVQKPKAPTPPKEGAPERLREQYLVRLQEYREGLDQAQADEQLAMTAVAVVGVETQRGSTDSASVDQLRALRTRAGGILWLNKLWAAVEDAQKSDPAVPAFTSHGRSTNSQA